MSKCIKRTIHWLSVLSFCVVVIVQPLSAGSLPKGKVFQNQLISLGDDTAAVILHAQQMGYDYINGQPWSATRAREGAASGLGVLFNTAATTLSGCASITLAVGSASSNYCQRSANSGSGS